MYFKNRCTGLVWHITDKAHQRRLENDARYIKVEGDIGHELTKLDSSESLNDSTTEKADFKSMNWNDLRTLASEKGINIHGKKREQIEQELSEVGGVNDR